MSKDLNQCCFIGRLGADPEYRTFDSGNGVVNFRIGCNDDYKDKNGQLVKQADWINIVAFGKLAEIVRDYTSKGKQVFVQGRFKTEKYEKDGETRYATKIYANNVQLLGGRTDASQPAQSAGNTPSASTDFEEDIPF